MKNRYFAGALAAAILALILTSGAASAADTPGAAVAPASIAAKAMPSTDLR